MNMVPAKHNFMLTLITQAKGSTAPRFLTDNSRDGYLWNGFYKEPRHFIWPNNP